MSDRPPFPLDVLRSQPDAEDDYALVLMRLVESASVDPVLLRSLIFEISRVKLQKEIYIRYPRPNSPEAQQHLAALDAAIDRVERAYQRSGQDSFTPIAPHTTQVMADQSALLQVLVDEPEPHFDNQPELEQVVSQPVSETGVSERIRNWSSAIQFALLVAITGGIFYLIVPSASYNYSLPVVETTALPAADSGPATHRNEILPTENQGELETHTPASILRGLIPPTQGVYAIAQGRLHRLGGLSARIPDERVSIGPVLTSQSETILPDGHVAFVVYRRDAMSATPERVKLRLIAKVKRSLTLNSGKPIQLDTGSIWAVRGKFFELDASRFGQNKDMVLLRPAREDFVLPPGRYALLLEDGAYDFLVDGVISDPSLCLESVQTLQGTVYSECQKS